MSFLKKLFGTEKKEEPVLDPFADLVLEKMKPGYLVDYDARTWEVSAHHHDDMGDGYRRDKWELRSEGELHTLSREEVDGISWFLTRKVPLGMLDPGIRSHVKRHGDPPELLELEGTSFTMRSYGGAKFYRNGQGPAQPFLYWEYRDETGAEILIIEQWSDIEFQAQVGHSVEEYQFINILPARGA